MSLKEAGISVGVYVALAAAFGTGILLVLGGRIAHELGHLYCGHLGTHDPELWPDERLWPDRSGLTVPEAGSPLAPGSCWAVPGPVRRLH